MSVRRFMQIIKVKEEKLSYYKELHAKPWPEVIDALKKAHVQNYSIALSTENILFAYFEYTGDDFNKDMTTLSQNEATQRWWKETDPCQESLDKSASSWWLDLEEVFHMD